MQFSTEMKFLLIIHCLFLTGAFTFSTDTDEEIVTVLADATKHFAASLYHEMIKEEDGNLAFSPFTAQWILSLISEAVSGKTLQELIPHINFPTGAIQMFLNRLHNIENKSVYNSANRIFLRPDIKLNQNFAKIAQYYYRTTVQKTNFLNRTAAAITINKWIGKQLFQKNFSRIRGKNINRHTNMDFVSAIYLNVSWKNTFVERKEGVFFNEGVDKVKVLRLEKLGTYKYFEDRDLDAKFLEIPYEDITFNPELSLQNLSMVIILPKEKDGLSELEQNIHHLFETPNFTSRSVLVKIPKFSAHSTGPLKNALKQMKITSMFDRNKADFTHLAFNVYRRYYITNIVQETFFSVNEIKSEGYSVQKPKVPTTAYAIGGKKSSVVTFNADHPFIYYVQRDGVVLFAGRVTNV